MQQRHTGSVVTSNGNRHGLVARMRARRCVEVPENRGKPCEWLGD